MTTRTYSLADLYELVAAAVPEREAVVCGTRRLTYARLNERADRLAAHLQRKGIGAGDTVGLQLYNCTEYLEAFLAACKLRAIPININFRYVAQELRYLYDNAGLSALVYSAPLAEVVQPLLTDFPAIRVALASGADYEAALGAGADYAVPRRSDDDLSLLYTGGTTGMPKGVMWPHRSLFFSALGGGGVYREGRAPIQAPEEIAEVARTGHPMRFMAIAPLMHGAALWASLISLFAGQTVILRDRLDFDAGDIWDLVERERANIVSVVGDAMAIPLLDALKAHPGRWALSALRVFGSGGGLFSARAQEELRRLLPHVIVLDSVGSSESGTLGSGGKPETGEGFIKLAPRPDLRVVSPAHDRFVGPGEEGVVARVGHVAIGYWRDPKKSAETFTSVEGVRVALTGDMAKVLDDGSIVFLGRGSQCIDTGGEKVFPEEVEEVLHHHDAVADAVVVGVADPRWGNKVVAVVSLREGAPATAAMLKEFCRQHLAGYKVPKEIVFVGAVARSPAGKADYRWARDVAEGRPS